MLQVDLLVDRRHVTGGQFVGGEVVAVLVRAGPAENEGELRIARGLVQCRRFGLKSCERIERQIHRKRGVTCRRRLCVGLGARRASGLGGDEEQFSGVFAFPADVLGDVVVHFHAADSDKAVVLGEDFFDFLLPRKSPVAV